MIQGKEEEDRVGYTGHKKAIRMKVLVGVKSYSDFQKMLNQWGTTKIRYRIINTQIDMGSKEVHYIVERDEK